MTDVKIRGGHRAMATKIISRLENALKETHLDLVQIKVLIDELTYQKDKISSYDDVIQAELDDDDIIRDMEEALNIRSKIKEAILLGGNCVNQVSQAETSFNVTNSQTLNVKLPTLNLPIFKGNPLDWSHFWDVFNSAINIRRDISDAQKFTYLVGQLRDEAAALVDGFTTTDAHYGEAVKLLRETYGDPKRIIQSHLHALFDLPKPSPNSCDLSKFRSTYECHLRGLKVLGTKVDEAGFVFAALLLRKLPARIRDNINRAACNNFWELEDFRKAINTEIILLQDSEPELNPNKVNHKVKSHNNKIKFNSSKNLQKTSTINNLNVKSNFEKPKLLLCRLCYNSHHFKDCEKYSSPREKSNRVKELHLCAKCLNNSHSTSYCMSKTFCNFCKGPHNSVLCYKVEDEVADSSVTTVTCTKLQPLSKGVALPTANVNLKNNDRIVSLRALFDQGSQKTFLLKSAADKLSLKPKGTLRLSLDGFNTRGKPKLYQIVEFELISKNFSILVSAILIDNLPSQIQVPGLRDAASQMENINVMLADNIVSDNIDNISLLIGADYYFQIVTGYLQRDGINMLSSKVGHMIVGNLPYSSSSTNVVTVLRIGCVETDSLQNDLDKIWSLDSIGIKTSEMSLAEQEAINIFYDKVKYHEGHYVVPLPWKKQSPKLKSNYPLARGRLDSLLSSLRRQNMINAYDSIIKEQLKNNFIEKVENPSQFDGYYIPHLCVRRESATTPLRVVFDCSAGKPSLNDCLLIGPSFVTDLGQILLKFRLNLFASISDIEKAFLSLSLDEEDRDYTRFLWPLDPHNPNSPIITYRFKVVLFGANCSPFLLNSTIKYHLECSQNPVAKDILKGLYVDNLVYTSNNENDMIDFFLQANKLMKDAGLNLREWVSNSQKLSNLIKLNNKGSKEQLKSKILGLFWEVESDSILFPPKYVDPYANTKRKILKNIACIFDPLGILLPVTIRTRIFLQSLWKLKLSWDECISEKQQLEWQQMSVDLNDVQSFKIARNVSYEYPVTLHAFCDASNKAYGAVIYAVNDYSSYLVIAKAKVAPIKLLTIPQLELTAALLAARLISYVKKSWETKYISETYLWTDSQVVMRWLRTAKPLKNYVQNRVVEIKRLTSPDEWKYVPTKDNPSDLITRGVKGKQFLTSQFWLKGPQWLCHPEEWPVWEDEVSEENVSPVMTVASTNMQAVLELSKFSSLHRVFKITCLIYRFIFNLRRKINSQEVLNFSIKSGNKMFHRITSEEWKTSETYWLRAIQNENFRETISHLKGGSTHQSKMDPNFFLENEVIRCQKRLENAPLDYNVKYPILLPAAHTFTKMLVRQIHCDHGHPGVSQMIVLLRQQWWFPRMRQVIKSVIHSCVICKRIIGRHYKMPPVPPLPKNRLVEAKPFTVTGIDYTGAYYVKERGKQERKVYIVLFTCASTRAIHLEVADDLSCEAFIRAFRRFTSRRHTPSTIYTDNALNFQKASQIFSKISTNPNLNSFLQKKKIEWKFIPPRAPWFGGFWERLIGLTKIALKKILLRSLVSKDEFVTILTEIEMRINNRPLTYAGDAKEDLIPLTPSHLLYGYVNEGNPEEKHQFDEELLERTFLTRRQRYISNVIKHFWSRWSKEYLTSLKEFHYASKGCEPKVGDVVLIKEDLPRIRWKMAKILRLHRGIDGHHRSAEVKTSNGTIIRPIVKLFPIEISDSTKPTERTEERRPPSTRKAAIEALRKIKEM